MKAVITGDNFNVTSGLTQVAKNLRRILDSMGYETFYCSVSGPKHDNTQKEFFIGNSVKNFDNLIKQIKPDMVVTVHDPWYSFMVPLSQYRDTFRWVFYAPVESDIYPQQVVFQKPDSDKVEPIPIGNIYANADIVIPYNKFGEKGLRTAYDGANIVEPIANGLDPSSIYKESEVITQQTRAKLGITDDTFLLVAIGRNSLRKRQDVMLEAWAKFVHNPKYVKDRPIRFYMHSEMYSVNGFDLPSICKRLNIQETMIFPQKIGVAQEEINKTMNAMDALLTLSGSEGHGLPVAEAMHLGKPVVYGVYGGHSTFCKDAGIEVPVRCFVSSNNIDGRKAIHNSDDAAEAIYQLYKDKQKCIDFGHAGQEKAKELYWDKLDDKFKANFEKAKAIKKLEVFARRIV